MYVWVWITIEPIDKVILDIRIFFWNNHTCSGTVFLKGFIKEILKYSISTDHGGTLSARM
jgi:hypothetical protein